MCKAANNPNRKLSDLELLVVEGNEQTANVFGLREVTIKLLVKVLQNCLPDGRVWGVRRAIILILTLVGDADCEKLLQDIVNNLD